MSNGPESLSSFSIKQQRPDQILREHLYPMNRYSATIFFLFFKFWEDP